MKNKVLVILAASATALGSAIFVAPAHAVDQNVNVSVSVDPVIYLRTFKNIDLRISQGELGGTDGDQIQEKTDGSTPITRTTPDALNSGAAGNATSAEKTVKELFAVWGNSPTNVKVTVEPDPTFDMLSNNQNGAALRKAKMTVSEITGDKEGPFSDNGDPKVGGVKLKFQFFASNGTTQTKPTAGTYTGGILKVRAVSNP
ncbi:hypothetical protein NIES4075_38730 [Tolypothrix sp. NIES-4075]|uniref:hypothetical protein n=1 Tax=Tolypothrix sp. NIES-4075 TaxID=2005459 RepID=UPI000B5C7DC1|nr:hypothetical protein [Tolypothrix sp. NIES-4075]GAX42868.1 hypothetical protein NIES4075_38730 [Tolypothrix sp. NIES-4075]